ncbi:glutamine synthetase family protein [Nocardioides hwasunensis]|uniref:Glutamine synthetase n=1 Tax=Nocardioides hwasunensis TaxID=397258 RepID=A0ABR8MHN8_9ACTN|nr:glutamine synthetase family protein [Nocardioides hwasunensis]MBD3915560.1 glutamine synthetase [Nocardioides hwasunensis]
MQHDDAPLFVATCDLAGQVRGRSVPASAAQSTMGRGVGWVPANLALPALGPIADNPFGSTGDLRLMPDASTSVHLPARGGLPAVRMVLADQRSTDGSPWPGCPRTFALSALADLERETGLRVVSSFEHEFMVDGLPDSAAFSFARHRGIEPFGSTLVEVLEDAGLAPETWLPEYGDGQFEITLEPVAGIASADRAIMLRELVRDLARQHGHDVTFAPLVDPDGSGNGVHVHLSLVDAEGEPALHDPDAPAGLSRVGQQFAAGIVAHARALLAITAPSPVSYLRLTPHRWSAGGVFLAERNREALLRICPTSTAGGGDPRRQYNLEFRAADATANPWLVLGVLVRAGLAGIRQDAPSPHIWPESVTEEELVDVPTLPAGLTEALDALETDEVVSGWFAPDLLETLLSVRRAEIAAVAGLTPAEQCRKFADVY